MENTETSNLFADLDKLIDGHVLSASNMTSGRVPLKKAPNAVVFIESPDFLDAPPLFPEQYNIVRDFFELLCPECNDLEAIKEGKVPREEQVLFNHDVCPECGLYKHAVPEKFKYHNELIGVAGQRSGKSALIAEIIAAYIHELLCVDGLSQKLGLIKNQTLDGSFAAAAGEQATDTVYGQFKSLYDESPWFQYYKKALLDLEIADHHLRRGSLYWETDTSIFFKEKKLRIKAISSNSASQAGKTRIFAIIDELARLDSGDSKRSADEVYRVLDRSLLTVRSAVARLRAKGDYSLPTALMACVTSPIHSEDKSMRLLKEAPKYDKMFFFKKATWEFNPNITREDLDDEFERDPVGAERDYGANPPGAENPFIKDPSIIELCVDPKRPSIFDLREVFFDQKLVLNGQEVIYRYIKMDLLNFKFNNLTPYVLHCDAGEASDSFCMAIGHKEGNVCVIDGAIEARPIKKKNPYNSPPRTVHFPSMVDILLAINNKTKLMAVTWDKWNSTDQIHRLIDAGIVATSKNLTRDDHVEFLNSITNHRVRFPARERDNIDPKLDRNVPCTKALYELARLNDNGMKVDHTSNGTNDMIQCYVGVHRILMSNQIVSSMGTTQQQLGMKNVFNTNTKLKLPSGHTGRVRR